MEVLYPKPAAEEIALQLRDAVAPDIKVSMRVEEVPNFEVLIEGWPAPEALDGAQNLSAVIVPFAGVPRATLDLVRERPQLALYNLHHNAPETAELAVALLLAAARRIVPNDAKMRVGDWRPRYLRSEAVRLEGRTALILGYGHIGRRVAAACASLGMSVLAVRRGTGSEGPAKVYPATRLHELLPQAQVLVIALPHTSETDGLLGPNELDSLPPGAVLVNIARAQIVDERALFENLKSGKLHSAGLDVWYQYPADKSGKGVMSYFKMPESAANTCPSKLPFHELENVVMSPHVGGVSEDTEFRRVHDLAEMLKARKAGLEMPHRVDVTLGY